MQRKKRSGVIDADSTPMFILSGFIKCDYDEHQLVILFTIKEVVMELDPQSVDQLVLVISNAPDELLAKRMAHIAVEKGLAACVNLGEPTLSMYMWQDKLDSAREVPITFKTTGARVLELMEHTKATHPYELADILVLPVIAGLDDYLQWVKDCTKAS